MLAQLNVVKPAGIASNTATEPSDAPAKDTNPPGSGESRPDDNNVEGTTPAEATMMTATAVPAPPVKRVCGLMYRCCDYESYAACCGAGMGCSHMHCAVSAGCADCARPLPTMS